MLVELNKTSARDMASQIISAGMVKRVKDKDVDTFVGELNKLHICRSNDSHVIALAQISGARLLYTNDRDLQDDFKDKRLISKPRGKIYSTPNSKEFTRVHKRLLASRGLCKV